MENQPAYYAVIPANVRYCKDLEAAAKLLYGEISALCNKEGYCWASNRYFCELYDVDISTVKRWIQSLAKHGFISVLIQKNGFQTKRKIFLSRDIKEKFTTAQTCAPPASNNVYDGSNSRPSTAQKCPTNNTSNNTKKKQQPSQQESKQAASPVVVFSYLKKLEISEALAGKLSKEYTESQIVSAVEKCSAWKTRKSDSAAIVAILKAGDDWKSQESTESIIETNRKHVAELQKKLDGKTIGETSVTVGASYIEFVTGRKLDRFEVTMTDFFERVKSHLSFLRNVTNGV